MERSRTSGNVGLDEHVSRRHEVCVGVGVETRGCYHELHDGSSTPRRVKLVGRFRSTSLICWVCVGGVPVDISTVDKTTNDGNGSIGKGFCGRIPALLLHGKNCCVVEPLALGRGEIVGIGTWVEDTDGFGTVVILVDSVVRARPCAVF